MVSAVGRLARLVAILAVLMSVSVGVVLADEGGGGDMSPSGVDCHCYHDWGDLPDYDSYGYVTSGDDGPRHKWCNYSWPWPKLMLGTQWDDDSDGQPHGEALGDDTPTWRDDEDGVSRVDPSSWAAGGDCELSVVVRNGYQGGGVFAGWLDWNANGVFDTPGEAFGPVAVVTGRNEITMTCGADFERKDPLFARFRLYPEAQEDGYSPTGLALGGEVEDYKWTFNTTVVTLSDVSAKASSVPALGIAVAFGAVVAGVIGWRSPHSKRCNR